MNTHTPGPWTIAPTQAKEVISRAAGIVIARCSGRSQAEFEWNVRLMATALELLEALKTCAAFIENGGDTAEFFATREAWRNAIAKAEGGGMNMRKHTPGPWKQMGNALVCDDPYTEPICTVYGDSREPNARLIATAPALLKALKEAQAFIRVLLNGTADEATDLLTNTGEEVEAGLRDVIDKAEGKN
jgi:hypothetical protein